MFWTSLYILYAAFYSDNVFIKLVMLLQTFFSMCHWSDYNNVIYHKLDVIFSSFVFLYSLCCIKHVSSLLCAVTSFLCFRMRLNTRDIFLKNNSRHTVIPHTCFRFFAFWFFMFVNNQFWSFELSLLYWLSVLLLVYV